MKADHLQIVPELEELLAFPYDKLSINEVAGCIGWQRDTVRQAMISGALPNISLDAMRSNAPQKVTRRASKAAVIQWLWRNLRGDKGLWRSYLAVKWPELLALLEKDAPAFQLVSPEPCAEAKKKIIAHPNAPKRREPVPFPDHPQFRLLA